MRSSILASCVFLTASATFAQDISVTPFIPVEGQPVLDFRIENCSGQEGYGLLVYGTLATAHHVTDLCFLEDAGLVVTGEVTRMLTATSNSPNGRIYEDLSMGADQYSRNYIHFMSDQNAPGCIEDEVEYFEHMVLNPNGYPGYTGLKEPDFAFTIGYTIPATSSLPKSDSADVLFGLRNVFLEETYEQVTSAAGDFRARSTFVPAGGSLEIVEGAGFQYGEAGGDMALTISENGELGLAGGFSARSNRTAGQQPGDMAELNGEVVHFRGHLLGNDGGLMLGYGVARGTMTDVSGANHRFRASAYLISCLTE